LRKLKAELILVFVAAVWAGTFVVIKVTLTDLPPFYFLTFRFFIAASIFYALFFKKISFDNKDAIKAGLLLGFFLFLGFASQTSGLKYTTASNSALITGVNLLIIPFAQYFITGRKAALENWIAVFIVMIGLFMLTRPNEIGLNPGDLITLICAVSWAFYIVYLDVFSKKFGLHLLTFLQFASVFVLSFILALIFESPGSINITTNSVLGLLYTALPATLMATFLETKYQKETTPVRAALLITFEQPAAVIMAVIFLNDSFNTLQLIGGFLMLAGIVFTETYEYLRPGIRKNNI
jgi:drug/metabolite transporter (DMT)-like permease